MPTCVVCGNDVPEGRMVCYACEHDDKLCSTRMYYRRMKSHDVRVLISGIMFGFAVGCLVTALFM